MTIPNSYSFDYQAEADKTCSIEWGAHNIDRENLLRNLRAFAEIANVLNVYKKMLFRGKHPQDLGMPKPSITESLTNSPVSTSDIDLVHGIVGIATEAGEAVEILISMIEGKQPDRVNAVEEAGDLLWYVNRVLRWADTTFDHCKRANIDKLHGRGFANGFDMFADANRDLDAERVRLEAATREELAQPSLNLSCRDTLPLGPHGDENPA